MIYYYVELNRKTSTCQDGSINMNSIAAILATADILVYPNTVLTELHCIIT
jgi:V8-like Glu-specific endopeptidase